MKVNNRDVSIFFHFMSKDLVVSKASLFEYYFNNEESNYLKVRQLPTPQVFSDFFKMVRFIEDTRKMGEE